MKSICVFCGAAFGKREVYRDAAAELGRTLAAQSLQLVWAAAGSA
ncbi:hypothetical protein [Chitinimonas koreensis]|nr:hypothetical protein [Chitinimonas koreensis]